MSLAAAAAAGMTDAASASTGRQRRRPITLVRCRNWHLTHLTRYVTVQYMHSSAIPKWDFHKSWI